MENFRRQFTLEAVESLSNLLTDLEASEKFSDAGRRDAFRLLHTVKGTAQTFGFAAASGLAHELESLLSADGHSRRLFLEGIELLIKSLCETNFIFPSDYAEKIRRAVPDSSAIASRAADYSTVVPDEIFSQLSVREKSAVHAAIRDGVNLYNLEIGFALNNFADDFINFRETLSASGDIIATFPSAMFDADGKVGFQILLASAGRPSQILEFGADIIFQFLNEYFSNDIKGVLAQAVSHGKAIARKYNKRVEFEIQTDEMPLSPRKLKLVFDVLLHLIRNAVDHAFENKGTIKIDLRSEENGFRLMVADDGRGIDEKRIKAKAIEKKLIAADKILTERETIDLIFSSGFSTKSDVSEISGRGIGLDAVKSIIEKNGGKISVETEREKGAAFRVFLPRQAD